MSAVSLLFLLCLGGPAGLSAAEVIELDVSHEGGLYTVQFEVELDVKAENVHEVLTSYHQFHRLTSSIKESRVLPSAVEGIVRVYTYIEDCVLFFCNGITRVEDIYQSASGELTAVIVPELSDFKTGTALWRITARGERTLLAYGASMQPGFPIPPIIGSYLVKMKLRSELLESIKNIECCASDRVLTSDSVPADGPGHVQRKEIC